MHYLNEQDTYKCLYINVEVAQAIRENIQWAEQIIVQELSERADYHLGDDYFLKQSFEGIEASKLLNTALTRWCRASDKPIVLLIDEIDSLVGDTLISVLRQVRSGYDKRPGAFPQTVVLCGVPGCARLSPADG